MLILKVFELDPYSVYVTMVSLLSKHLFTLLYVYS